MNLDVHGTLPSEYHGDAILSEKALGQWHTNQKILLFDLQRKRTSRAGGRIAQVVCNFTDCIQISGPSRRPSAESSEGRADESVPISPNWQQFLLSPALRSNVT